MTEKTGTVLIIDDSALNLSVLKAVLSKTEYDVLTASDGTSGLAAAREHKPDLIILDVMMPDMDGFEVCEQIRADSSIAHTMVMMLSANDSSIERTRAGEVGADDFMAKPYEVPELRNKVDELIRRGGSTRPASIPTTPDTATRPLNPVADLVPSGPATATGLLGMGSRAKHIAVFSPSANPGLGYLSANIAVALAQLWHQPTMLIDIVPAGGQSAAYYGYHPTATWEAIEKIATGQLGEDHVSRLLHPHASGVHILATPASPLAEPLSPKRIAAVYNLLRNQSDYIITECPPEYSVNNRLALRIADRIVIPFVPVADSVYAVVSGLVRLTEIGIVRDRIKLALLATGAPGDMPRDEVVKALNTRIDISLPGPENNQLVDADSKTGALIEDFAFLLSKQDHRRQPPDPSSPAFQRVVRRLQQRRRAARRA